MDILSKNISALIGNRLQETLRKHGCDEQNGFLNKKGCIDGSFCLNYSLHTRKSFGYGTWVLFIDLVKAFETVNRNLLLQILKKYGLPDNLINIISKLYKDTRIKFKNGETTIEFEPVVGVK